MRYLLFVAENNIKYVVIDTLRRVANWKESNVDGREVLRSG
jgi:hypothetical protein